MQTPGYYRKEAETLVIGGHFPDLFFRLEEEEKKKREEAIRGGHATTVGSNHAHEERKSSYFLLLPSHEISLWVVVFIHP